MSDVTIVTSEPCLPADRKTRWADVMRALDRDDDARTAFLKIYKGAGFNPDDFGRLKSARLVATDALTRVEDQIELMHPRAQARDALRAVRRRLEVELDP